MGILSADLRNKAVSMAPTEMQFTRTSFTPSSSASAFVKDTIAPYIEKINDNTFANNHSICHVCWKVWARTKHVLQT